MAVTKRKSSPVAEHVLQGQHSRFLPGCSGGQHQHKPVIISNSMMQTYVSMRGPSMECVDDPLFEWIRLRGELQKVSPQDSNHIKKSGLQDAHQTNLKDITVMLAKIDEVLDSPNPAGDSPRDAVFELERPLMEHIEPPAEMDLSIHVLTACCTDFEFEHDSDDDEGNISTGRISPCTFLAWSKDCARWDDNSIKVPEDKNIQRLRPPTPDWCDTPPAYAQTPRQPPWGFQQFDVYTGGEMSPHYPVPSDPSIIYLPEGIDDDRLDSAGFESKYTRMDPFSAMKLRDLKRYSTQETASPTGDNDHYAYSEVEQLVKEDMDELRLGFSSPSNMQAHIGQQYADITLKEKESDELANLQREHTTTIRALERRKQEVAIAVDIILHKRKEKKAEKRRHRIKDHVVNHVREVEYKHLHTASKLEADRFRQIRNEEIIQGLERDIFNMCFEVGKICPEEVFTELDGHPALDLSPPVQVLCRTVDELMDACKSKDSPFAKCVSEYEDTSASKPAPLRTEKLSKGVAE